MSKDTKAPIKITRSKAIELLRELNQRTQGGDRSAGAIFSATWVTRGSDGESPYVTTRGLRFGVRSHLKGGELPYDPNDHALMTVYEPLNRATALKDYQDGARAAINKLNEELLVLKGDGDVARDQVTEAKAAAQRAAAELSKVQSASYLTKKARTDAEKHPKQAKRAADSALKKAQAAFDKLEKKRKKLSERLEHERMKLRNPSTALSKEISAKIERRQNELTKETDADKQAELQRRLAREQEYLNDPVSSLLENYLMLNLNGLLSLTIDGQRYVVTTAPSPPVPVDYKP